jgi:two-component system sensor histidine kinase CiaH
MKDSKRKLWFMATIYWVFLAYIVAALVWWFVSLEKQNEQMYYLRVEQLKKDDNAYFYKEQLVEQQRDRKNYQYVGEGIIFLAILLTGAFFLYRAIRRQLKFSLQQQNFMMAVTHELKTPIAVARLNLETIQKRRLEEAQLQKLIHNTLQETQRLNELCNNILLTSQLEGGAYFINRQEINLSEMADQAVSDFRSRYPNRTIENRVTEGIYVNGEPLLLQMLLNNLVDNALKYSPKDRGITVALNQAGEKAVVQVMDEGCGIAEEERRKIFRKFYRVGNENTRSARGTGLGLYLCKKIAEDHNGYITVTNNAPRGSTFTVTLQAV